MDLKARLERLTGELDQYEKLALLLAVGEQAHELVTARRNLEQLIEYISTILDASITDENNRNSPLISSNTAGTLH